MAESDQQPTERVVLRLAEQAGGGQGELWEVVGRARSSDKATAIKSCLGEDPKPGMYRAPSLRSWKGGLDVSIPEKPTPETKLFEG